MNRRDFLRRQAGISGLAAAPLSSWLSLQGISRLAAQAGGGATGYRALVCLFLSGGNDSFNMLVPRPKADPTGNWGGANGSGNGEAEWNAYTSVRGAVNVANLNSGTPLGQVVLPLYRPDGSLHERALNAQMPRLAAIFNGSTSYTGAPSGSLGFTPAGRHAALVCNLGTVVEPVTAADVRNRAKLLPLHLQSHSDQISQWQSCFPQGQLSTGWAGRLIDQLYFSGPPADPLTMISLDGTNLSLTGSKYQPFSDSEGSAFVWRMSAPAGSYPAYSSRRDLLQQMLTSNINAGTGSILADAYLRSVADGLALNQNYATIVSGDAQPAITSGLALNTSNGLVGRMRRTAHIIKAFRARALAGGEPKRQIFFVNLGGWDHHNGLGPAHRNYLSILDSALAEFYAQLQQPSGTLNDVTLFTASDFGRALVPNGDGSDHAWGGNHIVLGGAVNGGQIYGQYPKMKTQGSNIPNANADAENLDIYGNGVLVPTLSADQYMQRLGRWFLQGTNGQSWSQDPLVSNPEWSSILPNWTSVRQWNSSSIASLML